MRPKVHRKRRRRTKRADKSVEVAQNGTQIPRKTAVGFKDLEVEFVPEPISWVDLPEFKDSSVAFSAFVLDGGEDTDNNREDPASKDLKGRSESPVNGGMGLDCGTDGDNSEQSVQEQSSSKRARKLNRLTVAELKNLVQKPEIVDWVDVTAADPRLLVSLKSYRNSVPVPFHWCQKRRYLQGKRGIEKSPFELPDFIKATGIMEIRSAVKEKEDAAKLKTKTRERHRPKLGKLDMDYQKLHDAFFRWQTKPKMTIHGDLYYEGKEFETKLKTNKPGKLSEELCTALGMPPLAPPPWLINMQRYGPPPSYPQLKIPGLNAPIPEGGYWGYHPGGWGKPPVDEYGRPLYGDIFGTMVQEVPPERKEWGKLIDIEEEIGPTQEALEIEMQLEAESAGIQTPSDVKATTDTYADVIGGISSVPSGLDTPESIELCKAARNVSEEPKQLYTIMREKQIPIKGFLGPEHVYEMPSQHSESSHISSRRRKQSPVDVAFNLDELQEGLDTGVVKKKYEQPLEVSNKGTSAEDFSDMAAEHANKQAKRKQKKSDKKDSGEKKGYKEFKF